MTTTYSARLRDAERAREDGARKIAELEKLSPAERIAMDLHALVCMERIEGTPRSPRDFPAHHQQTDIARAARIIEEFPDNSSAQHHAATVIAIISECLTKP